MSQIRHDLDELLARMPSRTPTGTTGSEAEAETVAVASLAQRTLERIAERAHAPSRAHSGFGSELGKLTLDEVLRTPLPLEPGEPSTFGSTAAGPLASGRVGVTLPEFEDVFAPEFADSEDFDPLRVPQKSGEHAPIARARDTEARDTETRDTETRDTETRDASARDTGTRDASARAVPPERRNLVWLWGGASGLAAAAALLLLVRSPGRLAPTSETNLGVAATHQTTSEGPANGAAAVEPTSASPSEAQAAVAQQERAAPAFAQNAAAAAKPQANVAQAPSGPRKIAGAAPAKFGAGAKGASGAADPLMPEEPALVLAAGPSDLPDHPSLGAISAATAGPLAQARQCLTAATPQVSVRVSFGSTGKVTQVSLADASVPGIVRSCISAALGRSQVPPFARKQYDASLSVSAR